MRSTEWLPVSRFLLTRFARWAGSAPRAAISDRGRSVIMIKPLRILSFLGTGAYLFITVFLAILMLEGRPAFKHYLPNLVTASLPNFAATALFPTLLIFSKRKYTLYFYFQLIAAMFIAMCLYEVAQLWMPRRTFDWNDIFASFLGAVIAGLAGLVVPFPFLSNDKTEQGAAANP